MAEKGPLDTNLSSRLFVRLVKLTTGERKWMLLAVVLGFATIASSVSLMSLSAWLLASAALHPSIAALQVAVVGVRFFGLSRGVFRYLERYVSHEATFRLLAHLRVWFYAALEPLAPARLLAFRGGDLFARVVSDIETLEHFFIRVVSPPFVALLITISLTLFFAHYSLALAVVLLVFHVLSGVVLPAFVRFLAQKPGKRLVTARADLQAELLDTFQGMAEISAFGLEQQKQTLIAQCQTAYATTQQKLAQLTALQSALQIALTGIATVLFLAVAIPLVQNGTLSGVALAAAVLGFLASFESVQPLANAFQHLETSLSSAQRLFEVIDTEPAVREPPHPEVPPSLPCALSFENVCFSYSETGSPILENLTFTIPPGARIALVGPSGSGKSTCIHLLQRFWDPTSGMVRFGTTDIRQLGLNDLRSLMSVVTQHDHLFSGTIRENLLLAQPDATQEELENAAQKALIHDFIVGLPDRYHTWIGENGTKVSGGERQRLLLARAFLRKSPFLVLDEALAHLDSLSESAVLSLLQDSEPKRTTLFITHRLNSLQNMDIIFVLNHGRIVEQGTYRELMERKGFFYEMSIHQRDIISS